MENKKLTYYDIYGFILAVDEPIKKAFDLEYWRFKVQSAKNIDLFVMRTNKKDLPVKLRHDTKGIYIPFGDKEKTVWYERSVKSDWVVYSVEPLIRWKDKCFLHCGAVGKEGEAILFPAEGGVGKTTMATFLVRRGYEYLSDDWLIIGKDGKAYPFFKTVHVFDYNLKDRDLAKRVLGGRRLYYKTIFLGLDLLGMIPSRFARIVSERLKPIFSVDVTQLNPKAKLGSVSPIKRIYWLKKDNGITKPVLKKGDYKTLSKKMAYITALETHHFYKNYLEWAYHNPSNSEIESRIDHDQKVMESAFKRAQVYELSVPAKINPEDVYNLIK